jgi:D-alanyl-D-alanine carboxypeptidase.
MPSSKLDSRTEANIATLLPEAQEWARAFMQRVLAAGIGARIISGTRTYEEQNDLYAMGARSPAIS